MGETNLAVFAVGACVYGLFVRILTDRLGDHSAFSKAVIPLSVAALFRIADSPSAVVVLAFAFLIGWGHDELVKFFGKLVRKLGGE